MMSFPAIRTLVHIINQQMVGFSKLVLSVVCV